MQITPPYPLQLTGELSPRLSRSTLKDVPDYPARIEVECPKSLSRGLVLVKWWLLALPHYLVVAVFAGDAWAAWTGVSND